MNIIQRKLPRVEQSEELSRAMRFLENSMGLLGFPLLKSVNMPMLGGASKEFGQFSILLTVNSSWENESCFEIVTFVTLEIALKDGTPEWVLPAIHCALDAVDTVLEGRVLDAGREFFQKIPAILAQFEIKPGERLAEGIEAHEPPKPVPEGINAMRVKGAILNYHDALKQCEYHGRGLELEFSNKVSRHKKTLIEEWDIKLDRMDDDLSAEDADTERVRITGLLLGWARGSSAKFEEQLRVILERAM